jgi:hypothetical protein
LAAQRAQEQRERQQREAAAVAAEAARRAQEDADRRAADQARLAEQRNQEAAARRAQEEAAIRAEQARAGIETLAPPVSAAPTYTPRDDTFVESILNVEDILAPSTPSPAVAVDEFTGLPPSMTDASYVPPTEAPIVLDPVMEAVTGSPIVFQSSPAGFDPVTNPFGLAPAPSTRDSFSDRALAATQRGVLNTAGGLATGIGSLAEAIAPRSVAEVGYGRGEIDPRLAAAVGVLGDRVAVGDPNFVTQGAMRTAESLDAAANRVFGSMSPGQQANLTDPLYTAEDGVNFPALGAQLYQGAISLAPTLGAFFVNPLFGAAVGGAQGSGDVAGRALERVDSFATANNTPGINLTPEERSAMESAALETSALYAPIGALSAAIYGSRLPLAGKVATGSAEEALEEGVLQPSAGETIGRYAIAPDDFRMGDVDLRFERDPAIIGALLGGGANLALGGGSGRAQGPTPAPTGARGTTPAPGAPNVPSTIVTPGTIQIPGTDVVVNTAPVTPMVQAPALRAPAALGTGGAFQPGVTQQGAVVTPTAPAPLALPAPEAQPTADLQTAADIIDAGLARDGGIGSETFQAVDEATGGRLNMMDVQAIMEQRMAERNAAAAFDPDAALARLQARFPGARLAEPTVETTPPAQPAFDPDAALARLRGQFPGIQPVDTAPAAPSIETVADTTVSPPALPAPAPVDTAPDSQAADVFARAEAQRQAQAEAQAEANRQAQAARVEAERAAQAEAQAEANRQAQAARQARTPSRPPLFEAVSGTGNGLTRFATSGPLSEDQAFMNISDRRSRLSDLTEMRGATLRDIRTGQPFAVNDIPLGEARTGTSRVRLADGTPVLAVHVLTGARDQSTRAGFFGSTVVVPDNATAAEISAAADRAQELFDTNYPNLVQDNMVAKASETAVIPERAAPAAELETEVEVEIEDPGAAPSSPTVAQETGIEVVQQPTEEEVLEGEILDPEFDVSTDVVPPREGVTIDQRISRDLVVPTQRPVFTQPELATEQETSPLVLVSTVDDEPSADREQAPVVVEEEEDTGGGEGGEDTEVAVEVEPNEDGECPPGFVRRLVDGQLVCVPEEEEVVEEEEEPPFECPPGFRRVQMANGGFTCVPEMARPRAGPFTGTVDVSGLEGRTVFRPGTRRT